jgi:hypothetical protein
VDNPIEPAGIFPMPPDSNPTQPAQTTTVVPHPAESYGNVPQDAESFGNVPQTAASFGKLPHGAERTENHTITVREAARLFEAGGVARIERSIVNWCQPNRQGVARLDCYFDPNERKYYITPQSIERAIAEEKDKIARHQEQLPQDTDTAGEPPKTEEPRRTARPDGEAPPERIGQLEQEVMDLKILNRGKDFFIEKLKEEREGFALERREYVEQLMTFNRKVGELETELRQLAAPRNDANGQLPAGA